ncbi:unnamed protein product [Lampetra fluviatilis]
MGLLLSSSKIKYFCEFRVAKSLANSHAEGGVHGLGRGVGARSWSVAPNPNDVRWLAFVPHVGTARERVSDPVLGANSSPTYASCRCDVRTLRELRHLPTEDPRQRSVPGESPGGGWRPESAARRRETNAAAFLRIQAPPTPTGSLLIVGRPLKKSS